MKKTLARFLVRTGKSWVRRQGRDRWGRTRNRKEASVFTDEPVVAFRVYKPYKLVSV